jgi:hypothetical protein
MKRKNTNSLILSLLMVMSFGLGSTSAFAQNAQVNQNSARQVNTTTRILYHDGSVMIGSSNLYVLWYGCWDNNCGSNGDTASQAILNDFMVSLGSSPYFQMNAMYPNGAGQTPSGALLYGGFSFDPSYSHGRDLTAADIQGIITDKILASELPPDPAGIYWCCPQPMSALRLQAFVYRLLNRTMELASPMAANTNMHSLATRFGVPRWRRRSSWTVMATKCPHPMEAWPPMRWLRQSRTYSPPRLRTQLALAGLIGTNCKMPTSARVNSERLT